jgi:hypothetical protein
MPEALLRLGVEGGVDQLPEHVHSVRVGDPVERSKGQHPFEECVSLGVRLRHNGSLGVLADTAHVLAEIPPPPEAHANCGLLTPAHQGA